MAFVFVILLLPGLHVRGYPLPLAGTPLVIPLSFMYMLWSLEVEGDTEPELVAAIAGWIISSILIVLSLVQLTPTIAGDASEFKSLGVTMKNHAYHRFLFWAGSGWMYLWTVIGLYATDISIPGSLCIQILIGVVCLVLGIQKDSMLLRMSGLVELCAAILLGAFIDDVSGFVQVILLLVGSLFALGSAGMYFYWQKQKPPSDEIRPTVSLEAAPATDVTDGSTAPTSPHPVSASELTVLSGNGTTGERQPLIEPEPEAGGATLALSDLDDSKLATSQLGLSGPSDELFDTLMAVSGMNRADFSPSQANILR